MGTLALSFSSSFSPSHRLSFIGASKPKLTSFKSPTSAAAARGEERRKRPLHEMIFKPLDNLFSTFKGSHLPPFLDPNRVLSGGFSPVEELLPTACEVVEGALPPCLDGAYLQNGPNPHFTPRGPYHLVDGDGMVHSVRISGGVATFCSRFVKTNKYLLERELGYPVYPNMFGSFTSRSFGSLLSTAVRIISGQFNPFVDGVGTANTSFAVIGGELCALVETDVPYGIKITPDGDVATVGRRDFDSADGFQIMTAHPKFDPETGETFAFRYFIIPPFLKLFRIDSNGKKHKSIPIFSVKGASFVHDFAVTKNFAIFPDSQIVIDPFQILRGRSMMKVDLKKIPKLGVIPRYAKDESDMYWVDAPGLNLLHTANSWEEDGGSEIVIVASNMMSVEHVVDEIDLVDLSMEKIVIDAATKVVRRFPLSDRRLDFGVINPKFAGRKNRYIYAAVVERIPKMLGVVKIDLSLSAAEGGDCTVASRMYGVDCYGSEPIFVEREAAAEEDDGYLVTYVNNEVTQESHFVIMDAKSPTLEIVASVKLPRRVPQGFHSIFVKESDLHKMYIYAAVVERIPKMLGMVKIDLSLSAAEGGDWTVASRMYGADCYGSEPIFVEREAAAEEDDGYLVTYVNNEVTQESHFVIMDAKSPTLEIVAAVKLPWRVPQGFHSIFVKESDLHKM